MQKKHKIKNVFVKRSGRLIRIGGSMEKTASGRARTGSPDENPIIVMSKASKPHSYNEVFKRELKDLRKKHPSWPEHHLIKKAEMYASLIMEVRK